MNRREQDQRELEAASRRDAIETAVFVGVVMALVAFVTWVTS